MFKKANNGPVSEPPPVNSEDLTVKSCPITGLNRPTGFQEVKAPRFLDIGT
jgi:hypothetical protein